VVDDIAGRLSRTRPCEAGVFGIIPGEATINVALFDNVGTTAFEERFRHTRCLEYRESTVPNERENSSFKWWSFPGAGQQRVSFSEGHTRPGRECNVDHTLFGAEGRRARNTEASRYAEKGRCRHELRRLKEDIPKASCITGANNADGSFRTRLQ
jgi:hypothetical protein